MLLGRFSPQGVPGCVLLPVSLPPSVASPRCPSSPTFQLSVAPESLPVFSVLRLSVHT